MPSGLPPDGYQRNWTPEGIEKLRKTIQKNRPWEQSTGPRTPEGKAIVRQNAIFFGYRIRDPKIVTDPIFAELKLASVIIDYELNGMSMPAGERIYRWACRVVELNPNSKLGSRIKKSYEEWREGAAHEGIGNNPPSQTEKRKIGCPDLR